MYKERKFSQENIIMMSMEEMVPKDHLLRKIDKKFGFQFYQRKDQKLIQFKLWQKLY